MSTVTITTAAWGGYWEKYGKTWTNHILQLNPAPTEVIVVSDKPIDTQFTVVIETDCNLGVFRNAGIRAASSTWIVPSDLDDTPLPNYLEGIDDNYDIIAFNLEDHKGRIYLSSVEAWNNIFNNDTRNPLVSCSAVKRELLLKVPYRKIGWEDWALWIDLKRANAVVKFDSIPRYKYNNVHNSLSRQHKKEKDQEILELKRQII